VVVLAIIAILIAAAVPLYLGARKKAYKAEADNALQELKTMMWAYYQQYASFPATGKTLGGCGTVTPDPVTGFNPPNSKFWQYSYAGGTASSIVMTATGCAAPLSSSDQVNVTLNSDGSSTSSSTF
jgi:type IV pilus assembly protein PilE